MTFEKKDHYSIGDLLRIMEILRSENGCPWDREQDHASIRKNFIEETYEVCEAIDQKDSEHLCEELGDVLLQVVFHSQMEKEAGRFTFDDVADGICRKLIYRHPHIFGDVTVSGSEEVLKNWDALKKTEKHQSSYTETLESVPAALPALMRAEKVQKRAGRAGMAYPSAEAAFRDLRSEVQELDAELASGDAQKAAAELGDVLFAAVNVARHLKVDPEEALTASTNKFIRRFEGTEKLAQARGIDMPSTPIEELDKLWAEVKQEQKKDS